MIKLIFFYVLASCLLSHSLHAQTLHSVDSVPVSILGFNAGLWQADSNGNTGYRGSYFHKFQTNANWLKLSIEEVISLLGNPIDTIEKPEIISYIYEWYGNGYIYLLVFETKQDIILNIKTIRGCG